MRQGYLEFFWVEWKGNLKRFTSISKLLAAVCRTKYWTLESLWIWNFYGMLGYKTNDHSMQPLFCTACSCELWTVAWVFFFFQFFLLADSLFSFPLTFNSFYQIFWMFCLTFIYQWNVAVIFICWFTSS